MVSDADMNRATGPCTCDPGDGQPLSHSEQRDLAYRCPVHGRRKVKFPKYTVEWSEEDKGFVATCDWFPSMSWIEPDCVQALSKYADMLLEHFGEEGLALQRDYMNGVHRCDGPWGSV